MVDNSMDMEVKMAKKEYYQVSYTVNNSPEALWCEIRPFSSLEVHYSRNLITLDRDIVTDLNGIRKVNAVDWLIKHPNPPIHLVRPKIILQ